MLSCEKQKMLKYLYSINWGLENKNEFRIYEKT